VLKEEKKRKILKFGNNLFDIRAFIVNQQAFLLGQIIP
jgi:hypothetical protein